MDAQRAQEDNSNSLNQPVQPEVEQEEKPSNVVDVMSSIPKRKM